MLAHLNAAVLHPVVDNNIPAALEHARRAAELAPNNPRAHLTWGTLLLEAGKCPEAFAALERAVELRPSVDEGHYRLARAAACGGQPQRAIDEYLYLMARHPGTTAYYLDLALLYEREGMLQEAGDTLEKALLVSGYSRVLLLQVRNFYARTGQSTKMQEIDEELQRRFPAEKKRKMRPLRPSKRTQNPQTKPAKKVLNGSQWRQCENKPPWGPGCNRHEHDGLRDRRDPDCGGLWRIVSGKPPAGH